MPLNVGSGPSNVSTAPSIGTNNTSSNIPSNPSSSITVTSTISHPTTVSTTSSSYLSSISTTSTSTSTPSTSSSSTSGGHQSPYDLRRKSPLANSENWNGSGPSTSQQFGSDGIAYLLPARKRSRRSHSITTDVGQQTTAAQYLQYEMPDEVLLTIFSYLLEQDLCRVSLVCKRFNTIANDSELWKNLYQNVYEYDLPLFNPEPFKFVFTKPEDSEYVNPWKESFHQLYKGVHVRPGYEGRTYKGSSIIYFNSIKDAIKYTCALVTYPKCFHTSNCSPEWNNFDANAKDGDNTTVEQHACVFVHSGLYQESIEIDKDIAMIGAAFGNIAEAVVLQKNTNSTISFGDGTKAYVGYMTLRFSPEAASTVLHHKHFCLEIGENCCPTVDNCIIRSGSNGKLKISFILILIETINLIIIFFFFF